MKNEEKGITLIALVITIIVMLILVGVTVNVAINVGLFSTAKRAVTKTEEAKDSELRFMAMTNATTHNEEWVYEVEGEKIPIPSGFAPTEIEGENSLEDGIVIIDAQGNEFVWIPCTLEQYTSATFKEGWTEYWYNGEPNDWKDNWDDSKENENIGHDSLEKLKGRYDKGELSEKGVGFYVARYEAGIPENAPFHPNNTNNVYKTEIDKDIGTLAPVSKKGAPVWTYISQINSKKAAALMYPEHSYLIDSHAWNYICKSKFTDAEQKDSTQIGNYNNNTTTKYEELDVLYALHHYTSDWNVATNYSRGLIPASTAPGGQGNNYLELSTGASEDFKKYNIYDMAGNMWEWTTEEGTNHPPAGKASIKAAVTRGGGFGVNGSVHPVVRADGSGAPSRINLDISFRVVLYL